MALNSPISKTQPSARIAALLERTRLNRARLAFALDATASRELTWDMASKLTANMFLEAAKIGGISTQLVFYRGPDEFQASEWFADPHELVERMGTVRCVAGATQIERILRHVRAESARNKVHAAVFVGDAIEEAPQQLYDAAAGLGVPVFLFQEGDNLVVNVDRNGQVIFDRDHPSQSVESVLREIARLTGGAWARFDAGAAGKLGDLLQAVAAFAVGGVKALANQNTDSARKLIAQMKGGGND